jgi:hypothetical protein
MSDQQPLDDHKDHDKDDKDKKNKDADGEQNPGTKDDPQTPGGPTVAPAGLTGARPSPVLPPPGADKTVRIGNKDYTFDSPRVAAAIKESIQAAQSGPGVPIPQVLADNGFTVPPVGQPLGQQIEGGVTAAKAGAVIVSNNSADHAWYLGNGEAMTEQGEVKPVAQVINPVGPNDGIYQMPEPGTPVVDPTAAAAGQGALATSPPTVGTTDIPPTGGGEPGQPQADSVGQPLPH